MTNRMKTKMYSPVQKGQGFKIFIINVFENTILPFMKTITIFPVVNALMVLSSTPSYVHAHVLI